MSHFTLGREHPLDDRIALAAGAGFAGVGLFAGELRRVVDDGFDLRELHELLDVHDVAFAEVEVLAGWGAARPTAEYRAFEAFVWELVDEFEVPYVQAIGPVDGTPADAAVAFGALCDRALDHGALVGLEFLPFTNVVDAADALAIVEGADRPNGGVCVDVWHHARGADDLDLIRRLPPASIVAVQMSDGSIAPTLDDYKQDCLRHRVPPGEGEFDVEAFVSLLVEVGVDVPWDLEVCDDDVWGPDPRRSPASHVGAAADGMRRVLDAARHG
ncbi:sugar phosphate isomerase/epimerase family protein [Ilumatobacter sp.]|uniref:sugar phosphate isomerase/epimerase family protein n=1 Tax=Ilumatobacter sp. TaxID=1967498 RepID=UPI003B528B9A